MHFARRHLLSTRTLATKHATVVVPRLRNSSRTTNYRPFSTTLRSHQQQQEQPQLLSQSQYLSIVDSTINQIAHTLEDMADDERFNDFEDEKGEVDITVNEGVLSVHCGSEGTFIISRQTPTQQLWLSSPVSGPWHYTYNRETASWVCTKGELPFFDRMDEELSKVFQLEIKVPRNRPNK